MYIASTRQAVEGLNKGRRKQQLAASHAPVPRATAAAEAEHALAVEVVRSLLSRKMCEMSAYAFTALDTDGSGDIDIYEFRAAIANLRLGVPERVTDSLFSEIDADGSGSITHDEYLRFILRDTLRRKAGHAQHMLVEMDLDQSGTIEKCADSRLESLSRLKHGLLEPRASITRGLLQQPNIAKTLLRCSPRVHPEANESHGPRSTAQVGIPASH